MHEKLNVAIYSKRYKLFFLSRHVNKQNSGENQTFGTTADFEVLEKKSDFILKRHKEIYLKRRDTGEAVLYSSRTNGWTVGSLGGHLAKGSVLP